MPIKHIEILEQLLPDDFAKRLIEGGRQVLDGANPLRAHFFAAALREAVGHMLHEMAPDKELANASWFKLEEDGPTRKQRATFAIQGGLSDALVEELGIDASEMHQRMTAAMRELSKRTHVRPGTLLESAPEIDSFANEVVDAVIEFFETIRDLRSAIAETVVHTASAPAFGAFLQESNDMIDLLSFHSIVEQADVEEIRVLRIGAREIIYEAEGTVHVELNYGSGDQGATTHDSFPFTCKISGSITELNEYYEVSDMEVDTSSFYE